MRIVAIFLVSLGALVLSGADTLTLHSGISFDGQIVKNEANSDDVQFSTGQKQLSFKRSEVKDLKVDDASRAEFQRRRDAIVFGDSEAHFKLYKWAREQRLFVSAREELKAILAIDPNHAEARKALAESLVETPTRTPVEAAAQKPSGANAYWQQRAEYVQQVVEACKVLDPGATATEKDKAAALAVLKKDKTRATEGALAALDFRCTYDAGTRMGALKALEALQTSHPTVSAYLARSAVGDPDPTVRKAVVDLVKARKDDGAVGGMLQHLAAAFDDSGKVLDAAIRDKAVESIHGLNDDRRIYESLLAYVTLEVRTANVDQAKIETRQIDGFIPAGPNGQIIPISLPIQLPQSRIAAVKTTVTCPAVFALEALTGQDFGANAEKWAHWIRHNEKGVR